MEDGDGLFNIVLSSSDESTAPPPKVPRNYQSEEVFQEVKAKWKPKMEGGEIWKSLNLPIDYPSKPESQTILHAIEELYFFKRYCEALVLLKKAMTAGLQEEFKVVLEDYSRRCKAKAAMSDFASRTL